MIHMFILLCYVVLPYESGSIFDTLCHLAVKHYTRMINSTDLPFALGEVLLDLSAHRLMDVLVQGCITGNP